MSATGSSSRSASMTVGDSPDLVAQVLKDRTSEGGAVPKTTSNTTGDSCTWYANKECTRTRTCFDCLNTLLDGKPCMINPNGVCVSASKYDPSMDFRRAQPANVVQINANQFPSSNTTYCTSDDPYCALCRETWSDPFGNSELSYLNFCRGNGGCVCTRACDSPYHNENSIMQTTCSMFGYQQPSAKMIYMSIAVMATLCAVLTVATVVVRRWVNRVEAERGAQQQHRHAERLPTREPSGPRLALSGWLSMREKLIQTEHAQLQGNDDNTTNINDDQRPRDTGPAAPVVIDSVVGPAVTVEEGEGYLPASPSDRAAHHPHSSEPRPVPVIVVASSAAADGATGERTAV